MNDRGAPARESRGRNRGRRRGALHRVTAERLRAMIYSGELEPGTRVTEIALARKLGVSRTPLREAFRELTAEGLLEPMPRRGARIATLTAESIDELFPIMGALESLSGELACRHITDDEVADIRALHRQMAEHHARGDLDSYFRLNQRIHEAIMAATRNPTLARIYFGLAGRVRHARKAANVSAERWNEAMEEHRQMLAALESRDGETLASVLRRHLINKQEALKESVRRYDGGRKQNLATGRHNARP
ncbi:MAG: GntR family transcriptional regulator [Rhodospirillales bacterium]|nr:GntR family transcriptional regulator [Rhodospirillales bacterium]